MQGELLPYMPQNDWMITGVLILCFILMSWAVKNGKIYLINHLKNFFIHKERGSLFDGSSSVSVQYLAAPVLVTCILSGLYIYCTETSKDTALLHHVSREILLASYVISVIVLVIFKWLFYSFINWIFFDKKKSQTWSEAFFDLLIFISFLLFPVILVIVYFNLKVTMNEIIMAFLIIICKLLLFYKCIRNFYAHYYGIIHIILYFCALEIVPDLLIMKWVTILNNILTIKF